MATVLLTFVSSLLWAQTCPEGEYWVSPHSRKSYVRADGVTVSATSVKGHCRQKNKVEAHWAPRLKEGRPKIWEHQKEKFKSWREEEKIRFFEAMEFLPEVLWLDLKGVEFHRAEKSVISKNPGSSLKNVITLYDLAFDKEQNLARVIAHELAHVLFRGYSPFEDIQARLVSGWTPDWKSEGVESWRPLESKVHVAHDSRESAEEAFANNLEFYLFEKGRTNVQAPHFANWIDDHYKGKMKLEKKR